MIIQHYLKDVKEKNISITKTIKSILREAKTLNKKHNCFNIITEDLALEQAEEQEKSPSGRLAGLPISIKDCICVKNVESRAGSKILKDYEPTFNATVIQKLVDEGAIIIGKTSQDEFGFGGFSTNTDNIPKNPFDEKVSCGGSSGGSACFTQLTKNPHASISESTGGSIANPASFCSVSGLTPTYGLVSRYGLIDYANSLDKIGVMTKTTEELFPIFNVIKGHDKKDSTSLNEKPSNDNKVKKIAIIKEAFEINPEIKNQTLANLEDYDVISLPLNKKYSIPTYYIIAMAEASTNLAKYCGLRYGQTLPLQGSFNDFFSEVRSKYFTKEAKRRIILGTFTRMAGFRDAYYLKAMKTRTLLINEYKKAFKKYDVLISPTMPILPPKFSEIDKLSPLEQYQMDTLTVGPNLSGLPHLSVPSGFIGKLPIGTMLTSNHLEEEKIINFGEQIEQRN
ncbi:MAG: Asp-tRNA(Asn)/Glu-tRNA(Gln) amidotransferase GatCAB subunit A [Nanoarchaeota archaeon]|nr:Asp-tRNA(Asn)/Glu-tRNA(Gln) amidotransferase GatCAB subunit A [Nanoarchaeota archaeon]